MTKVQDEKGMQEIIEEEVDEEEEKEEQKEKVQELKMEITPEIKEVLEKDSCYEYNAICHSWFIARDNLEINWRKPYI